jgi:hypothetical protein
MTSRYIGLPGVAETLGVSRHAVHKWRSRHPPGSAHPFPEPDVEIDGTPGWLPDRMEEVVRWHEELPGRGVGGGRPTTAQATFFAEAERRGIAREDARRMLAVFARDMPDRTENEVCGWLVAQWQD